MGFYRWADREVAHEQVEVHHKHCLDLYDHDHGEVLTYKVYGVISNDKQIYKLMDNYLQQ